MGFRFRKSVRLGKFIRVNFSRSGMSLGLGPPGANMNVGPRGVRKTVGIPGTGLSYQTFSKWSGSRPRRRAEGPAPTPEAQPSSSAVPAQAKPKRPVAGKVIVVVVLAFGLYALIRSPTPPSPVTPTPPSLPPPSVPALAAPTTIASPSTANIQTEPISPPLDARPLSTDEIREVQTWLKAFTLDPGPIDGLPGPLTTAAVRKYEATRQLPISGSIDRKLLERLRGDSGGPIR
jgi:hypothetical protein